MKKAATDQIAQDEVEDPTMALTQPGVARALKALDPAIFQSVLMGTFNRLRLDLAAKLIRNMSADPKELDLQVHNAPNPDSSNYSLQRNQYDLSLWGRIQSGIRLSAGNLDKDDWMTFLEVSAKALKGRERQRGMDTAESVLHRWDARDEAIDRFPVLFRSARGSKSDYSILGSLACTSPHSHETYDSLKSTIDKLKGIGLDPEPIDLIYAGASPNPNVRSAFVDAFGAHAIVTAVDKDGHDALYRSATFVNFKAAIGWLIENGADPMRRDNAGHTVLQALVLLQTPLDSVAELMKHAKYDQSHLKDTMEQFGFRMTPDVAALIQAQAAKLSLCAIAQAHKAPSPGQ